MASFSQHRPVTLARRGMVAAPHYLAAEAGLDILKTGGNAIDAAFCWGYSSLPANRGAPIEHGG
jgi:gamma-glutamyltranspeptidase